MSNLFRNPVILALLSGALLALGWPPLKAAPLLFVALVPLFFAEDILSRNPAKPRLFFRYTFTAFLLWNLLTTYWIWHASAVGMFIAVMLNSLLMSLPFLLFRFIKRNSNEITAFFGFVLSWIAYEYFHMNWDLSWPWLTLGNGFAMFPGWIQWYEYTGVFGGTYWILMGNVLAFMLLRRLVYRDYDKGEAPSRRSIWLGIRFGLHLLIPIGLSWYIDHDRKAGEASPACEVVLVQPNIDPYNEKFNNLPIWDQLNILIRLSDSAASPQTRFFIWPETAIPENIEESNLTGEPPIYLIREFLSRHKQAVVLTGASTYRRYTKKETPTAREYSDGSCCYDAFNTALMVYPHPEVQVYHKSKLVPGVEQMPYPTLFNFLEPLALNMGGTVGSLGRQEERTVFRNPEGIATAPVICYESIYGEYLNGYIRNGAQFISIITNDGWWENTPGYRQHAAYASLRAIETRRSIARSANTGISAFYDQQGRISQPTGWWVPAAIKAKISLNDEKTFYVKHGDWIAKLSLAGLAVLLVYLAVLRFMQKS